MSWLVAAYCVFFVLFFVYTVMMSTKQRNLDRRIEELKARLEEDQQRGR